MNSKRASMCHLAVISAVWLLSGSATAAERQPPPLAVAPFDAEAAKQHQQAWAEHLGVPVEITNSIGMKLILIPPGQFSMGSPDSDSDADRLEKPQHLVRITKPLYLGVTEVTQEQYERLMGSKWSRFKGAQLPVCGVSWEDAMEFCRKVSALPAERSADRVYRLPTEAEWEYACRAGSKTKWSFGDDESQLKDYAWYSHNSVPNSDRKAHPVAQKKPNAWGLYDMHGNVSEWCSDWCRFNYEIKPVTDPTGPYSFEPRVIRGGSWHDLAFRCRSAYRSGRQPSYQNYEMGFRVARYFVE